MPSTMRPPAALHPHTLSSAIGIRDVEKIDVANFDSIIVDSAVLSSVAVQLNDDLRYTLDIFAPTRRRTTSRSTCRPMAKPNGTVARINRTFPADTFIQRSPRVPCGLQVDQSTVAWGVPPTSDSSWTIYVASASLLVLYLLTAHYCN